LTYSHERTSLVDMFPQTYSPKKNLDIKLGNSSHVEYVILTTLALNA
jgi:hypothetical protein